MTEYLTGRRRAAAVRGIVIGLASVGMLSAPAAAELVRLQVVLDQAQEVPAPSSVPGAGGLGAVIVDTETNVMSWAISYQSLSGDAVGAHFHGPAAAGAAAGVVVDIGADGLGPNLVGTAELTAEQMAQLLDGVWYVNIHTAQNRPGEIRGQVVAE